MKTWKISDKLKIGKSGCNRSQTEPNGAKRSQTEPNGATVEGTYKIHSYPRLFSDFFLLNIFAKFHLIIPNINLIIRVHVVYLFFSIPVSLTFLDPQNNRHIFISTSQH